MLKVYVKVFIIFLFDWQAHAQASYPVWWQVLLTSYIHSFSEIFTVLLWSINN